MGAVSESQQPLHPVVVTTTLPPSWCWHTGKTVCDLWNELQEELVLATSGSLLLLYLRHGGNNACCTLSEEEGLFYYLVLMKAE